jgi:molybdate transport system regulatory protein
LWPDTGAGTLIGLFAEKYMKISARNMLPGIVRKIEPGAVNAEVTLELAPNLSVVSIITLAAVRSLQLKLGDRAYAVIKASSVMVGTD